ncbi:heavy-metal-associated domain-containing protein [Planctomicrobium sp. SH527]|uniref:heavy-metal-associated domain-containing protein n=1 Tax=Planctomicrobium sp. SH527 TaxID=3448123 RepID=UPI003F5B4881
MRFSHQLMAALAISLFSVQGVMAEQVKVEGVHICCGGCVKGVNKAMTGVAGVTGLKVSQDDETVTFEAKDDEAALAGLNALAKGGYYGKPSRQGPDFTIDASKKQDEVQITGLHLCCGACVKAVQGALKGVPGVKNVTSEARSGKVVIKGDKVSLAETLKALHENGFHGTVK